jgi:cobalt-zinc-cadmium efflux system outer membrane protein
MKSQVLALILAAGCVPSRTAVFGPVDREIERRIGIGASWGTASIDARVPAAVSALLDKPLDRDAAVRIALATNRRLQAQYDTLGIAASDVAAATVLAPLEVDIETKLSSGGIDELELDVTQDILDLIQLPQRRAVARAGLDAARARAVAATVELVASVERAYVDVVAAHQELELRQSVFDAASASADIAERQRAAGNIAEVALVREQNQREQARIDLGRAQVDVETARESLNELLGLTGKATRWTAGNRLADLPAEQPGLDALEKNAMAANLDVAALKADAEAAAGRVGLARVRAWLPELGIGVAADRSDVGWGAGPAISIGVPLFNQQQGPRARANAELKRARNEATATAIEVRARARAVRQRVLGAYAEARHLRDVVLPQRQRIVDETLKQYNAMNASTFELLSARRDLVDAGRQYIDALRRFWRASADARALARGALPSSGADQPRANASRSANSEEH